MHLATGVLALVALGALAARRYHLARAAAVVQVALILLGCALAQSPYLVPPGLTIASTAAPPLIHKLLLGALGLGSLVLVPSLFVLFRVFKGHTLLLVRDEPPAAAP